MIQQGDALIALSYSGKTSEVTSVCKHAKRLGVYTISITGDLNSPIAALSDCPIDGNVESEADLLNLAPTSSSTVCLAIGDAIAVTLMKLKGFKPNDFALLHPNGSLGRQLKKVEEFMQPYDLSLIHI